jgi:RND family efflux transporter MFP subunit
MKWKILIPVVILAGSIVVAGVIRSARPQPEVRSPEVPLPLVEVLEVTPRDHTYTVSSQGTVAPRAEIGLAPQVGGKVVRVSPNLVAGGYFDEGDVLFEIERVDYEAALAQAEAGLRGSELRLAQVEADADVAREEWRKLGRGDGSPLALREPQLAEAAAATEAARSAHRQAMRNLARTQVTAPFAGRVRSESIDVGQLVAAGTPVAQIYAVDYVEVRLPISSGDLAYLPFSLHFRTEDAGVAAPEVTLIGELSGRRHTWMGRIVRTEGAIDPTTRLTYLVARVDDPHGRSDHHPDRPPLAVGLFVDASIQGRSVDDVFVLPRHVLRQGNHLWVIDDEDRLHIREVTPLRVARDVVVLDAGLEVGERICLSRLDAPVDGMKLRTHGSDESTGDDGSPAREERLGGATP